MLGYQPVYDRLAPQTAIDVRKRHAQDSLGDEDGGAEGVRTPDLLNAIQALYQLSYDPIRGEEKCMGLPKFVKAI